MGNDEEEKIHNINIGILGHVDCGKTSLVRSLSTLLSTAALDKHPQSQQRGITLDLGFSCFFAKIPADYGGGEGIKVQITLVDCPGHASLIKTIIGGVQIIDKVLLVIDITKGIQAQTIECIVVAHVSKCDMIVVLNKVDLIPDQKKEKEIQRVTLEVMECLKKTRFGQENPPPFFAVSATFTGSKYSVKDFQEQLMLRLKLPNRLVEKESNFVYFIDHCFTIRGKGTIITGTVIEGSVSVGDMIEFPLLKLERKVKSLEMFHQAVKKANVGDRVGICLTNLPSQSMERGIATQPNLLSPVQTLIVSVLKAPFCDFLCESNTKYHITIGHETSSAKVTFFSHSSSINSPFSFEESYEYLSELHENIWAFIQLEHCIYCPKNSLVIGSRLDLNNLQGSSRIGFYGNNIICCKEMQFPKIYKIKERIGTIEKCLDDHVIIGKGLFKKESNMSAFIGMKVFTESSSTFFGIIESSFGKTGKFKVHYKEKNASLVPGDKLILRFSRQLFDNKKTISQPSALFNNGTEKKKQIVEDEKGIDEVLKLEAKHYGKEGLVEKLRGETFSDGKNPSMIVTGLFHSYEEACMYENAQVETMYNEIGIIGKPFGKVGKVRIYFEKGTQAIVGDVVRVLVKNQK